MKVYKEIFENLGYKVTAVSSSIDALDKFQKAPDDFDLLVTDMTMPKMTGIELSKNILLIRKNIPIVLLTGFNKQINEKKAKEIGIHDFIMKPVHTSELAGAVRRALDDK